MAEKRNNVKISVPGEPPSENPNGKEVLKAALEAETSPPAKSEKKRHGWLISSNDHPEFVNYGKETINMSPRSRQHVNDVSLLPSQLPNGITLKVIEE